MIRPAQINTARTMEFWRFILFDVCLQCNASLTGGPRTTKRNNEINPPGHPESRHLAEFGHLMAADLRFDHTYQRDFAIELVTAQGYHPYVGEGYGRFRLHVQAVPPGVEL